MSELIKLTEQLWKEYFLGEPEHVCQLVDLFETNSVVIGTGKQEFHRNLEEFKRALSLELEERDTITFQFRDFRCEELPVSDGVALVYGSGYIWWKSVDGSAKIDMDCRFSVLYKQIAGRWKILHIHLSVPNLEQHDGEWYPRTLTEQFELAQEKIESLTQLVERDSLTGLINYRYFSERYSEMEKREGWLYIIDIDDFKLVNDQYGHLSGNAALLKLAHILTSTVRERDLVCRMGGDEFILLCTGLKNSEAAASLAHRLLEKVQHQTDEDHLLKGISIGITRIQDNESLDSAFMRADRALYLSKTSGKNMVSML